MPQPKVQPPLHVSADLFRRHKLRIEKDLRIAADLQAGGQRARTRLDELRAIEETSFQQPEPSKPPVREERFVDACGWEESRLRMTYVSPSGETISEVVVLFSRAIPGKDRESLSYLVEGAAVLPHIPAVLFDAKLVSHRHAVPASHRAREIRMIPRVDERGAYLGVYSVMIDAR